jgi:hypothetical protein
MRKADSRPEPPPVLSGAPVIDVSDVSAVLATLDDEPDAAA